MTNISYDLGAVFDEHVRDEFELHDAAATMTTMSANPHLYHAPTMSGGDNAARQRAVKLVDANKRIGLHLGAGSGKSLVSMAAFTHLHGQGKAKRAIFAVPSIVQGQFGGEALRLDYFSLVPRL